MIRLALGLFLAVGFYVGNVLAHPLLPDEITAFLIENPTASETEFRQFLVDTYGEQMRDVPYSELLLMDDFDPFTGEVEPKPSDTALIETEDLPYYILKTVEDAQAKNAAEKPLWLNFLILGIEHILKGTDHVLFVITLGFIPLVFRRIWLMVSTFTVAHSLTFVLAGTGLLTLSGKLVEPVIALSIGVMAAVHVFWPNLVKKIGISLGLIFMFGLFHGLGFAGVFEDLSVPKAEYLISLVTFNIGVEIGQLIILAFFLPLVWLLQRWGNIWKWVSRILALLIIAFAVLWFIERVFL